MADIDEQDMQMEAEEPVVETDEERAAREAAEALAARMAEERAAEAARLDDRRALAYAVHASIDAANGEAAWCGWLDSVDESVREAVRAFVVGQVTEQKRGVLRAAAEDLAAQDLDAAAEEAGALLGSIPERRAAVEAAREA